MLLFSLWLKPRYQTNDDIAMIYAYSGTSIFSEATAVTAFSTKLWGLLMVSLYKYLPSGIEAYTIVFYLLILISNSIIHMEIFRALKTSAYKFWMLFIPVLAFITLQFYLELQFTMLAGLLCFTGVLLWMNRQNIAGMVCGSLFILIGSIIRLDVIPVVLAFLFSLYIVKSYLNPVPVESRKQIIKNFGLMVLVFLLIFFTDRSIHNTKEKEFLSFNSFRVEIVDYNSDLTNGGLLPLNWGSDELHLFKNWFYSDKMLYDENKAYTFGPEEGKKGQKKWSQLSTFNPELSQFRHPLFNAVLLLIVFILFLVDKWRRASLIALVFVFLYFSFHLLLSLFFKTPPFRVSFMMFAVCAIMFLSVVSGMISEVRQERMTLIVSLLLIFWAFAGFFSHLKHRNIEMAEHSCKESYDSEIVYIHWPLYPFEFIDPFRVTSESFQKNNIVWICSFSVHPAIRKQFKKFSYHNLTSDILDKEELVSFILPSEMERSQEFRSAYCSFITKHYQRNVYFEKVDNTNHCHGFTEFKLKAEAAPILAANSGIMF